MAGKFDFQPIVKGNTLRPLELTLTSLKDGAALDLSLVDLCWQIKYRPGDDEPVIHNFAIEKTDPVNGVIRLQPWEVNLPEGTYMHELTLSFPADGKVTIFRGTFKVIQNIAQC